GTVAESEYPGTACRRSNSPTVAKRSPATGWTTPRLWAGSSPSWIGRRRPTTPYSPSARPDSRPSTCLPTSSASAASTSATSPSKRTVRCASSRKGSAHETRPPPLRVRGAVPRTPRRHAVQHGGGHGVHLHLHRGRGRRGAGAEDPATGALPGSTLRDRGLLRRASVAARSRGSAQRAPPAARGAHARHDGTMA